MQNAKDAPEQHDVEVSLRALINARDLERAASVALRAYGSEILGYLTNVMNDPVAASEVFSQFAEDFWRGLASFEPRAKVRTWAFYIARAARARYYKDPYRKRRKRLLTKELELLLVATTNAYFASQTSPEDRVERVRQQLTPNDREIITLRVDREMTWDEVALVTGLTPATARKRFQRAKDRIRKILNEERKRDL